MAQTNRSHPQIDFIIPSSSTNPLQLILKQPPKGSESKGQNPKSGKHSTKGIQSKKIQGNTNELTGKKTTTPATHLSSPIHYTHVFFVVKKVFSFSFPRRPTRIKYMILCVTGENYEIRSRKASRCVRNEKAYKVDVVFFFPFLPPRCIILCVCAGTCV